MVSKSVCVLYNIRPSPKLHRTVEISPTMHAGQYNSLAKRGHDPLSLDRIRGILNRLEDTIIFALIERAQFAHNPRTYQPRAFEELSQLGFDGSWLEWFILGVESFHGELPTLYVCTKKRYTPSFSKSPSQALHEPRRVPLHSAVQTPCARGDSTPISQDPSSERHQRESQDPRTLRHFAGSPPHTLSTTAHHRSWR
jgi:hypothetical protein